MKKNINDFNFFDKKVMFKVNNTIISTRVISGVYPDTTKLIPLL